MKLYRVCTENKNYPGILNYLDEHFPDGYTVINANGAWQGIREKSLVIEIIGKKDSVDFINTSVEHLCYWLKKYNNQQAIMVQSIDVNPWLI
jgi:hypothetical protein